MMDIGNPKGKRGMATAGFGHVAVLGAGGMGTALAVLLARGGLGVRLWGRDPRHVAAIAADHENRRHLAGVAIPESVEVTADPGAACSGAELIVVAIPSAFLRSTLGPIAPALPEAVPALSVVKGIEFGTFARPSQIIAETAGTRPLAILSGPSHAEEFARDLPTLVVVAGTDTVLNRRVQATFNRGRFRVYTNNDAVGVELAGALKNILGIAAGICEGLGFGDNAKAALLTRGLVEMGRFAVSLGGRAATFAGLAGVGDVITTCFSPFGRNRAVGLRVGRGEPLEAVLASMDAVAEGVPTTRSVHEQAARLGVEMPITAEVHGILYEGKPPLEALTKLMLRPPKEERP
jgi:glycerol-3-phosphate dehydrogenase (NAD(P)+)